MKALKYLFIGNINFNKTVIIKLSNLKLIYCDNCKNFRLSNIICKKLKTLYYHNNNLSNLIELIDYNFKEIKELNLRFNNISDIEVLEKAKFDKLELLFLGKNKISNIRSLGNFNFKKLKILDLTENKISDFQPLEKVKFDK